MDSPLYLPTLETNSSDISSAFSIALGDIISNIAARSWGMLDAPSPVLKAGWDYPQPWTRDAAINVWNGLSLLAPRIGRNTLLSVLEYDENGEIRIGGQYWDAIIWCTGAWQHYLHTGDREFLSLASTVTQRALRYFEQTEFDSQSALFRGRACYGDGIAAYPDQFADEKTMDGCISRHCKASPEHDIGVLMRCLSTNCLYFNAYQAAVSMAVALGKEPDPAWTTRVQALKAAINSNFWDNEKERYRYLINNIGEACEHQEGLGISFAILFGIAGREKTELLMRNAYAAPAGIPCLWPAFPRYCRSSDTFGRHCGTVWPHVQGFWARAAVLARNTSRFSSELFSLAKNIHRDGECREIYHPTSGLPYGGLQEWSGRGIDDTDSCRKQAWSATAFASMIVFGLAGLRITQEGIGFSPMAPKGVAPLALKGLWCRDCQIDLEIQGAGTLVDTCEINGKTQAPFIAFAPGECYSVRLRMKE